MPWEQIVLDKWKQHKFTSINAYFGSYEGKRKKIEDWKRTLRSVDAPYERDVDVLQTIMQNVFSTDWPTGRHNLQRNMQTIEQWFKKQRITVLQRHMAMRAYGVMNQWLNDIERASGAQHVPMNQEISQLMLDNMGLYIRMLHRDEETMQRDPTAADAARNVQVFNHLYMLGMAQLTGVQEIMDESYIHMVQDPTSNYIPEDMRYAYAGLVSNDVLERLMNDGNPPPSADPDDDAVDHAQDATETGDARMIPDTVRDWNPSDAPVTTSTEPSVPITAFENSNAAVAPEVESAVQDVYTELSKAPEPKTPDGRIPFSIF